MTNKIRAMHKPRYVGSGSDNKEDVLLDQRTHATGMGRLEGVGPMQAGHSWEVAFTWSQRPTHKKSLVGAEGQIWFILASLISVLNFCFNCTWLNGLKMNNWIFKILFVWMPSIISVISLISSLVLCQKMMSHRYYGNSRATERPLNLNR